MLELLSINSKYFYHNLLSVIMVFIWIYFGYLGYRTDKVSKRAKISFYLIAFCLFQEFIDILNRLYLDPNYHFSIQRDIPFLQFCQLSFYFSILCIILTNKQGDDSKYSLNQFFFDGAFLLGFSGAFQGIITPDFLNINNLIGVICIQLQHSLIILNLIWLMFAYNYKLKFKGVCFTYLLINVVAGPALLLNNFLGKNSSGEIANYFYVNELPKVDNYFLNFVSKYPSPEYIYYIQPIFIIYFLALYIPFYIFYKYKK